MLNFFNSPAKREDGKWLEFCGDSCITIRCLGWQHMLLLLICLGGLTVWAEEQTMPASSPHSQHIHTEHIPRTLLQRSPFPDKQGPGTPVQFWKENALKILRNNSHKPSVNSKKPNKQNRLLKRDVDNLSQNKNTSSSEWTSAMNEIVRQIFGGHVFSPLFPMMGRKSVAKNDVSSSPSSFQVETLRNINVDADVVEAKPNISISAHEIEVMSTQKYSKSSMQENMSSGHSLNEDETKSEATLSSERSVTTLHYSSAESSDGPHTEKLTHTADWRGANFPVTHVPQVSPTNGSSDLINSTPLTFLTNLSDGHTKPTSNESSNHVTKTFCTTEHSSQCVKVNDGSNTSLVMPVHLPVETTTVNTITPSFEATSAVLQVDQSHTRSSLRKPAVTGYNVAFSDMNSSSASTLLDSPHTLTSQKQDDRRLPSVASDAFSISALPLIRGTLDITSSNPDQDLTDVHKMISTEGRIERSSLVMDSKSDNTLFAVYNLFTKISHGSFTTPLTNLHIIDIAATTEHEFNSGEQTYTAAPQDPSTWSALKTMVTIEDTNSSSDVAHFKTDTEMLSNVSSQPLTNFHMSDIAATTEHELNSGEQMYTGAPQAPSTWPTLKTIVTTEETNASSEVAYFQDDYKMFSNVTSKPLINLHIMNIAVTTEHELNSGEQTYTAAPQAPSTWPALKKMGSTEILVSTDVKYFETDYKVPSNFTSQLLTDLHMSEIVATTEHELHLFEQTYTAAPQALSTRSALKTVVTTEETNVSSDVAYFQMDYKMLSNVTSQLLPNLHTIDIDATTKHELNSGEQTYTAAPHAPSTWPALKKLGSTEETIVSTDVKYFQTDNKVPSNVTSQPLTNLHMSDIAATTERELYLFEQPYTAAPQALSTRSSLKTLVTTDETKALRDEDYFQTYYKIPLDVTSQPYPTKDSMTGILESTDVTTTQSSLTLSETTSFTSVMELTTYEMDKTGLSASINVTLDRDTLSENSFTLNTFTNGHYTESDFTSTVNPYPFQNGMFYDALNENNLIQTTSNMTSKQRSTTSPGRVSKSITYKKTQWGSKTSQFNSTVSANPHWNSSKRTLYSTVVPQNFSITKDHITTFSYPSRSNVSLPDRAGQKSQHSTLMPAVMQRTAFTKSKAALETPLPVKPSSYRPYMTTHQFSTMLSSTGKGMLLHQATASPSQEVHHISHQTPKLGTVTGSSTHLVPKSVAGPSASSMKLVFNLLISTRSTSSRPSVSTQFQSRNGTAMAHTNSSFKPANTFKTPALRLQLPQARTTFPPNTTSSVSTNYILTYEVSTTPSLSLISPSVVKIPMSFHLTGILYSKQLSDPTTEEYRTLEREIMLVLNKIFSSYYLQEYVQTEILAFLNGSVIVRNNVVFDSRFPTPSCSDIVRTVLSAIFGTNNYFAWNINGSTVECKGYTQNNLEIQSLPISFLVLRAGYIAVSENYQDKQSFLDYLQKQVFQDVNVSFPIRNVSFSQIRDVYGDLEVKGFLYLNSPVHINVQSLLSTLLPLVNRSVDFSSVTVAGGKLSELKVHSILFRVINQPFVVKLLDMSSPESQILSKDLSMVVQSELHDHKPLQVIIREFKSGSIVCRGDLLYQLPAPGSKEILQLLLDSLGSDGILGSSSYKVDSKTISVGGSSPGPHNEYVDFPGFGVAIIVMCGLLILIFPALVYVCYKTRMLGHRNKATIQQRHEPDNQSHHFEMDNRAFRASIEQP
ncbi:mucin-3B-like [Pseudophryne corroboree]|uniref:mucin-3B-like n=1 Tax=Pseudophryne corroboree TaxID=495146 RepID=UPI003081D8BA